MEKHWSSVVSRSVCDYFFEAQSKATSSADLPPVISTPHYYLVSIYRCHLYFVAVLQNEGQGGHYLGERYRVNCSCAPEQRSGWALFGRKLA